MPEVFQDDTRIIEELEVELGVWLYSLPPQALDYTASVSLCQEIGMNTHMIK